MSSLSKISRLGMSAVFMGAAVFMSSCSKQEAQAPEPRIEATNSASNLRDDGGLQLINPKMPITDGIACDGCLADGWTKDNGFVGTSTLTALYGSAALKWVTPLPAPSGPGNIITAGSANSEYIIGNKNGTGLGVVAAEITNLIIGKTYSVTVQVASARVANSYYGISASVMLEGALDGGVNVNFENTPAQWHTRSLTFVATKKSTKLTFIALNSGGKPTFANIFVGKNAIKRLD